VNGVRIDKWLWAARFFKTRALASKACELGRVLSNSVIAKAAREVRIGDTLQVRNEAGDFVLEVLTLSEVRRPAAVAQTLYRETEESKQAPTSARPCSPPELLPRGGPPSAIAGSSINSLENDHRMAQGFGAAESSSAFTQ